MRLARLGVTLGTSQSFSFSHRVCAGSEGKKSLENSKVEQTLMVSTHQTEFVLHRPSVCQQFSPRVHF